MFKASRLVLARKRRAMTKVRLAEEAGIALRSIAMYEKGETSPEAPAVEALARALRFPVAFFSGRDVEEPPLGSVSFRALSSMTAGKRDSAIAAAALTTELAEWIDQKFSLPTPNVPDLRGMPPDLAAEEVRSQWGAGTRPIRSMVHLLEANGVRVFSIADVGEDVDAFSFAKDGVPFVFLSTAKSAERSRFDAAHELGHLVLHRHGVPDREAERQADTFASSFLMPRASVLAVSPRNPSVAELLELKKNWSVSVVAMAYRLHALGMITEWHYRTLCIEMAQRGYRKAEPIPITRETSQVLNKVFSALRSEGITKVDVARELRIHVSDLEALVFGLVMVPVVGGASGDATRGSKASLRLV